MMHMKLWKFLCLCMMSSLLIISSDLNNVNLKFCNVHSTSRCTKLFCIFLDVTRTTSSFFSGEVRVSIFLSFPGVSIVLV
jgi:hypothetical protein